MKYLWRDKKYLKVKLTGFLRYLIPNKAYLKLYYRFKTGESLNLDNPKTFNEKIQWLKFHYRNPIMRKLVDKHEVRDYVRERIGSKYLIPMIGVYDTVDDIDFDKLPDSFIVKLTNGSSFNYLVKNKSEEDVRNIRTLFNRWKDIDPYSQGREWAYKGLRNRIVIEESLETDDSAYGLQDYRFFCFSGKFKSLVVDFGTKIHQKQSVGASTRYRNIYDDNFNFTSNRMEHPNLKGYSLLSVKTLNSMKHLAEKLAENFPLARVDFYYTHERIYFGEITFYPAAGYANLTPEQYSIEMGDYINIEDLRHAK